MQREEMENFVSCSGARHFNPTKSYIQFKVDNPITVRVGFQMFWGQTENYTAP